jgi:hypothetical protein
LPTLDLLFRLGHQYLLRAVTPPNKLLDSFWIFPQR